MSTLNKLSNCHNIYQGSSKRVLCVCSAGLLRSPTAAKVLSEDYGYNTRSAGLSEDYALIDVSDVLLEWADEIVVMELRMKEMLFSRLKKVGLQEKKVICLNIPDNFGYNDPDLISLIKNRYREYLNAN